MDAFDTFKIFVWLLICKKLRHHNILCFVFFCINFLFANFLIFIQNEIHLNYVGYMILEKTKVNNIVGVVSMIQITFQNLLCFTTFSPSSMPLFSTEFTFRLFLNLINTGSLSDARRINISIVLDSKDVLRPSCSRYLLTSLLHSSVPSSEKFFSP